MARGEGTGGNVGVGPGLNMEGGYPTPRWLFRGDDAMSGLRDVLNM